MTLTCLISTVWAYTYAVLPGCYTGVAFKSQQTNCEAEPRLSGKCRRARYCQLLQCNANIVSEPFSNLRAT